MAQDAVTTSSGIKFKGSIHNSSQTPAAVSGAGSVNVVIYST